MKSFAIKEKRASPTTRRTPSSVHSPLAPSHRLQQNNIRQIVQPKLTIGQPNDTYEQEADRVADNVVANQPVSDISSISGSLSKPGIQNIAAESNEDENIQQKEIQRKPEEEEDEPVQTKLLQRQAEEEEDEPVQTKLIQRQTEEEEDEPVQTKLIQRQTEEEEEEPVQSKLIQRQVDEEEEE